MTEAEFQKKLKKEIKQRFPDSLVFKTDANQLQGCPDLLILNSNKWAFLEVKKSASSPHRPNQDFWVDKLYSMSYAAFVYPENKEEVLNDLEELFKATGNSCPLCSI